MLWKLLETVMKVSRRYDQDPRYDWADIDLDGATTGLVIIYDNGIAHGFNYCDGEMHPTCICSAWYEGECSCTNLPLDYWVRGSH